MKLTRYEQETIVNFNAEEPDAIVYTRDNAVMRQLDTLVTEYPDIFKCIGETDIDKTIQCLNHALVTASLEGYLRLRDNRLGMHEENQQTWIIV